MMTNLYKIPESRLRHALKRLPQVLQVKYTTASMLAASGTHIHVVCLLGARICCNLHQQGVAVPISTRDASKCIIAVCVCRKGVGSRNIMLRCLPAALLQIMVGVCADAGTYMYRYGFVCG
jgi:hypothetical protein